MIIIHTCTKSAIFGEIVSETSQNVIGSYFFRHPLSYIHTHTHTPHTHARTHAHNAVILHVFQ